MNAWMTLVSRCGGPPEIICFDASFVFVLGIVLVCGFFVCLFCCFLKQFHFNLLHCSVCLFLKLMYEEQCENFLLVCFFSGLYI